MKRFHFSAILGVIYGQELSNEMPELLTFMYGRKVTREEWAEIIPICRDHLKMQFPYFCIKEIEIALEKLETELDKNNHRDCPSKIISDCLQKIQHGYARDTVLNVKPLSDKFNHIKEVLNW